MGMVRSGEAWVERWGRIGLVTGGDRGALCCCAVLLCVLCVEVVVWCCCAVLLCGVAVQCYCAGWSTGSRRHASPRGYVATGGSGGGRGGGERGGTERKLDKTTPCGRDILLHRGLAKCVAHLHDFD